MYRIVDLSGHNIFLFTFSIQAPPSLMFSLLPCEVFDLPFETTHVRMAQSGYVEDRRRMGNVNGAPQGYILNIKNGIRKTFPTNIRTLRFMRVNYFCSPYLAKITFLHFK